MKKVTVMAAMVFLYTSCQKDVAGNKEKAAALNTTKATKVKSNKKEDNELQTLIRTWTEWAYSKDPASGPFFDSDGSKQAVDQPYSSGVFMLAGSSSEEPVSRTVTISLSQYQYVFVPLVVLTGWYEPCEDFGPKNGQNPEAFFQSIIKQGFNGPKDLPSHGMVNRYCLPSKRMHGLILGSGQPPSMGMGKWLHHCYLLLRWLLGKDSFNIGNAYVDNWG